MSDEASGLPVKRRGAAVSVNAASVRLHSHAMEGPHDHAAGRSATPDHHDSFHRLHLPSFLSEDPASLHRGGDDSLSLPCSGGVALPSDSGSFVRDCSTRFSNTTATSTAQRSCNNKRGGLLSGGVGVSTFSTSPAASAVSFPNTLLRALKVTWRRRQCFTRFACAPIALFLLLLWWMVHCKTLTNFASSAVSKETFEDPLAAAAEALIELEDTLVDIEAMGTQEELSGNGSTWTTLIQHEDALSRVDITKEQRACLQDEGAICEVGSARINRVSLPSWPLSTVRASCTDCIVRRTSSPTVTGVQLQPHHAVAATSAAPLGRIGPMLFAMSSVTNDIAVQQELPRWSWMRHVYANFAVVPGEGGEGKTTSSSSLRPYLAVMGVPSTDQPARVALRTAQRATWMTYQEVARAENDFNGALLPLYLFAAVEPNLSPLAGNQGEGVEAHVEDVGGDNEIVAEERDDEEKTATATTTISTTMAPPPRPGAQMCGRMDVLLPTVREYQHASKILASANNNNNNGPADNNNKGTFVRRRVVLRSDYLTADSATSPCRGAVTTQISADAAPLLPLGYLAKIVGLNVTPSFVSGAEYVCCASAGLWREALIHRNVLWIDMLLDRRPTTAKKLGDTTKWGLPVEVGMSQKLILWLLYAHNTFTNVPFIIKGDDDMYVKIPQFLSDLRLLWHGRHNGRLAPLPPTQDPSNKGKMSVQVYEDSNKPFGLNETKCFYWGSTRSISGVKFNAGMLFLLQRRLARVVLERPQNATVDADLLELAAKNYSRKLLRVYKRAKFDREDVLIGYTLHLRRERAKELCYNNRVWYIRESLTRYHDLRRGRQHAITYKTVVAHRCRPADTYFIHYFFQNELKFAKAALPPEESHEEVAREAAAAWAAETRKTLPSDVWGWNSLPMATWYHNVTTGPPYSMAENDGVPVYDMAYHFWNDANADVEAGYRTTK